MKGDSCHATWQPLIDPLAREMSYIHLVCTAKKTTKGLHETVQIIQVDQN